MNTLRYLTCCLITVIFAISCGIGDWSYDEVARVSSPSRQVDAVLIEGNGGATVSFRYYLCVVPKGKTISGRPTAAVAWLDSAFSKKGVRGVDLKWESANRLVGEYLGAQDAKVLMEAVTVAGQQIAITLRSNINNTAVPAGGML